jgi:hypothetical protein
VAQALFRIVPGNDQWRMEHDGKTVSYVSKEAAFEAAVIIAQRAMREAYEVQIHVDPSPNILMGQDQNESASEKSL